MNTCDICKRPMVSMEATVVRGDGERRPAHLACIGEEDTTYAIDCHSVAAELRSQQGSPSRKR